MSKGPSRLEASRRAFAWHRPLGPSAGTEEAPANNKFPLRVDGSLYLCGLHAVLGAAASKVNAALCSKNKVIQKRCSWSSNCDVICSYLSNMTPTIRTASTQLNQTIVTVAVPSSRPRHPNAISPPEHVRLALAAWDFAPFHRLTACPRD